MAKKKKIQITPEMKAQFAETMRMLEERIAYHGQKIAEQKRRRGEAKA